MDTRVDERSQIRVWSIAEKRAMQIIQRYSTTSTLVELLQMAYLQSLFDSAEARKRHEHAGKKL